MPSRLAYLSELLGVEIRAVRRDPVPGFEWSFEKGALAPVRNYTTGEYRRQGWWVTFVHPYRGLIEVHLNSSDDVRRVRLLRAWTGNPELTGATGREVLRIMHFIAEEQR